jgi:membrane peptidoglycan carboxypeptidase
VLDPGRRRRRSTRARAAKPDLPRGSWVRRQDPGADPCPPVTAAYPGRAGKERIMETYLNSSTTATVPMASRPRGQLLRHVGPEPANPAQGASWQGCRSSRATTTPTSRSRTRAPRPRITRRNDVLDAMLHEGYITQREHDEAVAVTWEEMNRAR